jgi:GNAT superfamily N-acetyltransferase
VVSVVIRPSQKNDIPAISRVYVQTWQETYLGVVPYGYLYAMSAPELEQEFFTEQHSKQAVSYVAEDAGRIIGFISGGYERQGDTIYNGEIYALYVLKNCQRQGIGTKLVSALAARLNHFGIYSMLVWVLIQNPYRRFYEKLNGMYLRNHRMPFAGEVIDVAAYGWLDTGLIYYQR